MSCPRSSAFNLLIGTVMATTLLINCSREPVKDVTVVALPEFVGSQACQSCHTREFQEWQTSDHFRAMQHARDSTVLGDFDNATLSADGVTSRFFRKEGKFIINTQGDDGRNHDFEVLFTFGYFPLQQYLVAFPGGRLQATRASWDSRSGKWYHQYSGQSIHHRDWLHWTGNAQNWNTMCASCHSTNLQKNYSFETDSYATNWKDLNVGCESCHGPGSRHVEWVQSEDFRVDDRASDLKLRYGKQLDPRVQLNACAPCHARKSDIAPDMVNSGELLDNLIPQVISNEFYHADGQILEEDYEYGSFTQSSMYHNQVRCSSCHNPHSGKLFLTGNALCMNCHTPEYNTEKHHFHPTNTVSSQCISCHMPARTYMGNDLRRDHSFRVPRPDQSVAYGTPNTCNSCHTDKEPAWAAAALAKWYGPKRTYHFSDDLLPGSELNEESGKHLIRLLKDTLQPAIARATAAYYMGSLSNVVLIDVMLQALNDRQAIVRYYTLRSLEYYPFELWKGPALTTLNDRVRAVRIAAADLYHRAGGVQVVPASARGAYAAADEENQKFLRYQTDFSVGNVMQADYYMQGEDHLNAIRLYARGLKKDSLMNYARMNMAVAFTSGGKNAEALRTLQDAAAIDPANGQIFYNLGLLQYEMGDDSSAFIHFDKALKSGLTEPGLYYNYGLLLLQVGKQAAAEKMLLAGLDRNQQAANINYALAYLYATQNRLILARKHATILKQVDGSNPAYQDLFRNLGLL